MATRKDGGKETPGAEPMDAERAAGTKRPDTLRPGPGEGRRGETHGEMEPRRDEEMDDQRAIATEDDDEELDVEDEDFDDDDEDLEDEDEPARPVK